MRLNHLELLFLGLATAGATVTRGLVPSFVAPPVEETLAQGYGLDRIRYEVLSIDSVTLRDEARGKDLHVRVNHPDGEGPFPVIVFSHGAWGSKDNYQELTRFWAGHGYVTIQPNHSDSRALGTRPGDPRSFRDWRSRPADVSFIIDSLAEIEAIEPALTGKLDRERIGVGGHSFGAHTAQLVGGARPMQRRRELSFEDGRVDAVLLMSPQGTSELLTRDSWKRFAKPMLVMTGSEDGPTRTGQPAVWRKEPYELCPPGDKYLVWIEGLDHGFGNITGSGRLPANADHVRYTRAATLAYWDAYLRGDERARAYLASDGLRELAEGKLELERK